MSDLQLGPTTFKAQLKCDHCDSSFTASTDALECGGFKADPDTYWFDSSATSVLKFYVVCPGCRATIFVDRDSVPVLVQQAVHVRCAAALIEAGYKNYQLPRLYGLCLGRCRTRKPR